MTKALPYQNRGIDIVAYLLSVKRVANKAGAVQLLNSMMEAGYMVQINTSVLNSTLDENSDNDIYNEFNENCVYRLLKMNDGMPASGNFQLSLDVDNSSSYLNRPEQNMLGKCSFVVFN